MQDYRSGKKSLELACWVAGAGAFGVFLRWLQVQLNFDELGLAEPGALPVVVALYLPVCFFLFQYFVRRYEKDGLFPPEEFGACFSNTGHRLYTIIRIAAGLIICLGAALLFLQSETDLHASDYRILALLAFPAGLAFPIWLGSANRETQLPSWLLCLLSFLPMLFLAAWLIICYKLNTINSVIWSYIIELLAVTSAMFSFFRLGGYVFEKPNGRRCLGDCLFSAMICIMALADERYLGQQLFFIGLAIELLLCSWIIVKNLQQAEKSPQKEEEKKKNTGGFETL